MDNEITVEELLVIPEENYILIDIRDEYAFSLGHIDRSVNIPQKELEDDHHAG